MALVCFSTPCVIVVVDCTLTWIVVWVSILCVAVVGGPHRAKLVVTVALHNSVTHLADLLGTFLLSNLVLVCSSIPCVAVVGGPHRATLVGTVALHNYVTHLVLVLGVVLLSNLVIVWSSIPCVVVVVDCTLAVTVVWSSIPCVAVECGPHRFILCCSTCCGACTLGCSTSDGPEAALLSYFPAWIFLCLLSLGDQLGLFHPIMIVAHWLWRPLVSFPVLVTHSSSFLFPILPFPVFCFCQEVV